MSWGEEESHGAISACILSRYLKKAKIDCLAVLAVFPTLLNLTTPKDTVKSSSVFDSITQYTRSMIWHAILRPPASQASIKRHCKTGKSQELTAEATAHRYINQPQKSTVTSRVVFILSHSSAATTLSSPGFSSLHIRAMMRIAYGP